MPAVTAYLVHRSTSGYLFPDCLKQWNPVCSEALYIPTRVGIYGAFFTIGA